ncbi:DNA/RNA helicase, superfamily II, SNF2 family [Streptomyces sp. CBMAI 2042]|uniref:helicase-related protein n=1 Tax=Streptomyces sp. CBMAI 2042 TaxID=2305222 RepID=UPI000F207242|nr:helicase-related protein [Streptomyces sp. CBMAI 2042]RLV68188.1 DNA/RNA helicase, superfamily II, SNF2 family [Streptomyces sp. CBMAI 2042]
MVPSDAGHAIDRLRKHLTGATRVDSLSESFSLYVYEALQDELTDVDLRLLLHGHSLQDFPLNGLEQENLKRARLDQHRIARTFVAWAEEHLQTRALKRRARGTWTSVSGPFPYVVDGAGFEAESLGLVAPQSLYFPQETTDADKVAQSVVNFERMWHDDATTCTIQKEFLGAARALFEDRAPESVYLRVLTSLFRDFVEESGEETAERGKTGFYDSVVWNKLYKFQRDGVLGAIEKLERHNGCVIADSVGLGKTFEALAVIKYYELRNDRVLVLAPKRLRENWTIYRGNDHRNPLADDRFHYDVLNHTDLSRTSGQSGDIDLANVNWGNYDLVVIDESHNFRNNPQVKGRMTRYQRLMSEVFKNGVKTKVLMLSATPVNTRLADLKNQVLFATEGDDQALAADGIKSIEATLARAQKHFNEWQRTPAATRSTKSLAGTLGMDYIRLLDLVTIARSRKHIQKYYGTKDVGEFPERLAPINLTPPIDAANAMIPLEQINQSILRLNLAAYKPTSYVSAKHENKYAALYDQKVRTGGHRVWRQTDRENNVVHLLRVGLLKRLESSVNSLGETLGKILGTIDRAIASIDAYEATGGEGTSIDNFADLESIDLDDPQFEDTVGGSVKVFLADIDRIRWRQELQQDRDTVATLLAEVYAVDATRDAKLARLKQFLREKAEHPTNEDNRKALVFTAFSDTAEYLYKHVAGWANDELGVHVALITGQTTRTTLPMQRTHMIDVLTAFSPRSKGGDQASPQIDIVIATDTISEGQNLQDCDTVINYDIHWNPVRIVQRFGRVDRLGTTNTSVQLVNFWPNMALDAYINLETRVSSRMTLLDVSATGEENVLDVASGDMNDLDYRRKQLQQMQNAAPTMEDLAGGLSITDLTLSDFRVDAAARPHDEVREITGWPLALFGVTRFDKTLADDGLTPGAVFLLRVRDNAFAFSKAYPLAPYVLAYVTDDGELAHPIEEPKLALDVLRHHCLGSTEPDSTVLAEFGKATRSGRSMKHYRDLLDVVVRAASGKTEESMVASLFSPGPSQLGTDASAPGLEAVDVVAWLAVIP